MGYLVDRYGSKRCVLYNLTLLSLMLIFTFSYLIVYKFSALAFVMCFLWGIQDGAVNTHCMEMLGFEFEDSSDAFAVFSMFQGIVCFSVQLIQSAVIDRNGFIIYTACIGIIGFVSLGLTYKF